ncbi:MAG: exosortase/archaeosortase family protein [Candidatus Bathyarchaeia archaeon]|jgi:exosortase/archaeosortase family protein
MQPSKPQFGKIASAITQHRVAVALKFSVIATAVIALYFEDLTLVFKGALVDESSFHILAIPLLFAYLLIRKRKMINASLKSHVNQAGGIGQYLSPLAGISLCAVAILVYWYGSYTFIPLEYHMFTLPFLTAGLTLLLFNFQTLKQLLFPIAFLTFLAPPPVEILYGVGSALANISASASNALANLFGLGTTLSTNYGSPIITLTRPDNSVIQFSVDVACSGIYSIIGFIIFALFIAYITRGKFLNKAAVIIMGIPLIIALNIIRITTILGIGYGYGEALALEVFHAVGATVLMFIGTLILLAVTEKVFKKPAPPEPCPTCTPTPANPVRPFCINCGKLFKYPQTKITRFDMAKIVGILAVVVMLLSIQTPVFALTQGPAQVIYETPNGIEVDTTNSMLPEIPGYTLNYIYRDTAFEELAGQDASVVYAYNPIDRSKSTIWTTLEIAPSVSSEHRWETCLINFPLSQGQQASVDQLDLRDVQIQENPPITARYFAFEYKSTNQIQVVLYWYETAAFNVNGTTQTKSIKISLVVYPSSVDGVSAAEDEEFPIAVAINNHWQPIKTWTGVALALSQNGLSLSIVASAILVLLVLYGIYLDYRTRQSLANLYNKLPTKEQQLVQAVAKTKRIKNLTIHDIAKQYEAISQESISDDELTHRLEEIEKTGLIKQVLVNKSDTPTFVWRSQVLNYL